MKMPNRDRCGNPMIVGGRILLPAPLVDLRCTGRVASCSDSRKIVDTVCRSCMGAGVAAKGGRDGRQRGVRL